MTVVADLIDVGFLGVFGIGVWRGQDLWRDQIEKKHEREMARLSMDRMEKSIRLEMEQTRNLAEIERVKDHPELVIPELPSGERAFDPGSLPFVCACDQNPSWHLHLTANGKDYASPLSMGALTAIRDGYFSNLCACGQSKGSIHSHDDGKVEAVLTLSRAGWKVRRPHE